MYLFTKRTHGFCALSKNKPIYDLCNGLTYAKETFCTEGNNSSNGKKPFPCPVSAQIKCSFNNIRLAVSSAGIIADTLYCLSVSTNPFRLHQVAP